jgi:hypothetical protein
MTPDSARSFRAWIEDAKKTLAVAEAKRGS